MMNNDKLLTPIDIATDPCLQGPYPATEGGLADIVQLRSLREIPSLCETAEILKPLNVHGHAISCKKRIMYGIHDIGRARQLLLSF